MGTYRYGTPINRLIELGVTTPLSHNGGTEILIKEEKGTNVNHGMYQPHIKLYKKQPKQIVT